MSTKTSNDSNMCAKFSFENENVVNEVTVSYCTDCQEEIDNLGMADLEKDMHILTKSNNFDKNFLPNVEETIIEQTIFEPLNEATKSFSQINLEPEYFEENIENEKSLSTNDMRQIYVIDPNNKVEVESVILELLGNVETLDPKEQQSNNDKIFCDKQVQTEPQLNENNDPWDSEFPTEVELQKIEQTIKNSSPTVTRKQEDKNILNVQDNKIIKKKTKNNLKPNYSSITAIFLNRQKRLAHLANDLYQLSSYLDGIRKALSTKEPLPIKNFPSPPAMTGYDSQFDFPNENRFGKLPIQIQSAKTTNKLPGGIGKTHSTGSSSRNGCGLAKSSTKRMNNGKKESAPKRFMNQTTNKVGLNANKENLNNEKSRKQSIGDSTSMYEYNPLSSGSKSNIKFN